VGTLRGEGGELIGDGRLVLDKFTKKLVTSHRSHHPFGETQHWENWWIAFWNLCLDSLRSKEGWFGCERNSWWRNWKRFVSHLHWNGRARIFFLCWRCRRVEMTRKNRGRTHCTLIRSAFGGGEAIIDDPT